MAQLIDSDGNNYTALLVEPTAVTGVGKLIVNGIVEAGIPAIGSSVADGIVTWDGTDGDAVNSTDWTIVGNVLTGPGGNVTIEGDGTFFTVGNFSVNSIFNINSSDGSFDAAIGNFAVTGTGDVNANNVTAGTFTASGQVYTDYIYTNSGSSFAIDVYGRRLVDNAGANAIDWDARYLLDNGGQQALDWSSTGGHFYYNSTHVCGWGQVGLTDSSGVDAIDLTNRKFYDSTGNTACGWNQYGFTDSDGYTVVWTHELKLTNPAGNPCVAWGDRTLNAENSGVTVDWQNCLLARDNTNVVVDWKNQQLRDGDTNSTCFTWSANSIDFDDAAATIKIGGTQVITEQQPAVADATNVVDVITQLNALLAALRTHGLIAT